MRKHKKSVTVVLPLGIKNKIKTELPALVALNAIGEPWFTLDHATDLLSVALVVQEIADQASLEYQCATTLRQLCESPITLNKKVEIALNLAECLPWLQRQPNAKVQPAIERLLRKAQLAA